MNVNLAPVTPRPALSLAQRVLIVVGVSLGYVVSLPWTLSVLGDDALDLTVLPVAAVASLFGPWPGYAAAVVALVGTTLVAVARGADSPIATTASHGVVLASIAYGFSETRALVLAWRAQSQHLERSERALRTMLRSAPLILWAVDKNRRFLVREGRAYAELGLANGEHVGEDAHAFYRLRYPENPELSTNLERAMNGEEFATALTLRGRSLNATYVPVREAGEVSGVVCVANDVTEREQAEHRTRRTEARLDAIVSSARDAIITVDASGRIVIFNEAAELMFGYRSAEVLGGSIDRLIPEAERAQHAQHARRFTATGSTSRPMHSGRTLTGLRVSGEHFPVEATLSRVEVDGEVLATVIVRDITERLHLESELQRRALYDPLTDLPNRALLQDRIEQAIALSRRRDQPFALFVADLDNFKDTNDTLGHDAGDEVLKEVATRLRGAIRDADTVARLGGDEFAIVVPLAGHEAAAAAADRILHALDRPVLIGTERVDVSASIGIAFFPEHGDDRRTLLRHADVAMYQAKRSRRTFLVYSPEGDGFTTDQVTLVADLRAAIERSEIDVVFQPEVRTTDGEVLRFEALARWTHPRRGPIPPDVFVPLAERTGLVGELTRCVLDRSLEHLAAWRAHGAEFGLGVNLSVRDLVAGSVAENVATMLASYGLPGSSLSLEITESVLMADVQRLLPTLDALRAISVDLAIDDFGTGYSSLSYLRQLPVHRVKIDRSFIRNLPSENGAAAIVRAAVDMAHDLGLRVVAEGVETQEALDQLRSIGCDSVQGYFISRPLAPADVLPWLRSRPSLAVPDAAAAD
jgi:diguanylate cyclase (GGDEF)-like protein/PAS domain S-box-containing protein